MQLPSWPQRSRQSTNIRKGTGLAQGKGAAHDLMRPLFSDSQEEGPDIAGHKLPGMQHHATFMYGSPYWRRALYPVSEADAKDAACETCEVRPPLS